MEVQWTSHIKRRNSAESLQIDPVVTLEKMALVWCTAIKSQYLREGAKRPRSEVPDTMLRSQQPWMDGFRVVRQVSMQVKIRL